MATLERLGPSDATDASRWLIVRGTLREADLEPLLDGSTAAEPCDVTLDLLDLEELTFGGRWAIRCLADDLWRRGRVLTVLVRTEDGLAEALRSSAHLHLVVQGSPLAG